MYGSRARQGESILGSDRVTRSRLIPMALASRRFVVHAAEAANLSQAAAPKVSGQIEEALGAKLLSRHARGRHPDAPLPAELQRTQDELTVGRVA
jgi:hypothetical protein